MIFIENKKYLQIKMATRPNNFRDNTVVVIDSLDRDLTKHPEPNDYVIKLPTMLRNCDTIELMSLQLTRTETNVHSSNNSFKLELNYIEFQTQISAADLDWSGISWSSELNIYAAVAPDGVMTSTNGIDWNLQVAPTGKDWSAIVWASEPINSFVAVASNGGVMTSTDGETWSTHTTPPYSGGWRSITWSPTLPLLVAVGDSIIKRENPVFTGNSSVTSIAQYGWDTLNNWKVSASSILNSDTDAWKAFNKTTNGSIDCWHSAETTPSITNPQWLEIEYPYPVVIQSYSITSRNNGFILFPTRWRLQGSNNGTTWINLESTRIETEWGQNVAKTYEDHINAKRIAYKRYRLLIEGARQSTGNSNNKYVAIGNWSLFTTTSGVMTSPDGVNWTTQVVPVNKNWGAIAWAGSPSTFVALAYDDITSEERSITSSDGVTWSLRSAPYYSEWRGIAWSPKLDMFAAVASYIIKENPAFTTDAIGSQINTTLSIDYSTKYGWNTNAGWAVRASSSNENTPVLQAFNKTIADYWISKNTSPSIINPQWLEIEYPYPVVIKSYAITTRNDEESVNFPSRWVLQGSTTTVSDGVLDSLDTNLYNGAVGAYGLRRIYTLYDGAQVLIRRSSDNVEADIYFDDIGTPTKLIDYSTGVETPVPSPALTENVETITNEIYSVTASSVGFIDNDLTEIWYAFDKDETTAWASAGIFDINGYGNEWLTMEFPSLYTLDSFSLVSNNNVLNTPRDWDIQGSTDGFNYTTVQSYSQVNWVLGTRYSYSITNSHPPYNFWRINITRTNNANENRQVILEDLEFVIIKLSNYIEILNPNIEDWLNGSDAHVKKWYDQSTKRNHLVQETSSLQPIMSYSAQMCGYVIDFTSTFLSAPNPFPSNTVTDMHFIARMRNNAFTFNSFLSFNGSNTDLNKNLLHAPWETNIWYWDSGDIVENRVESAPNITSLAEAVSVSAYKSSTENINRMSVNGNTYVSTGYTPASVEDGLNVGKIPTSTDNINHTLQYFIIWSTPVSSTIVDDTFARMNTSECLRESPQFTNFEDVASDFNSKYGWNTDNGWEVKASSTRTDISNVPAWDAFDKKLDDTGDRWISRLDTFVNGIAVNGSEWIQMKFPEPVIVYKYSIQQFAVGGLLNWTLQGSNDGLSWQIVGLPFEQLEWNDLEVYTFTPSDISIAYTYWRIDITKLVNPTRRACEMGELRFFTKKVIEPLPDNSAWTDLEDTRRIETEWDHAFTKYYTNTQELPYKRFRLLVEGSRVSSINSDNIAVAIGNITLFTHESGGGIMTTSKIINWATQTSPSSKNWTAITWAPEANIFAAVAYGGTTPDNRVMTSNDGLIWAEAVISVDNEWRAIAWSPELFRFAAVSSSGEGNRVIISQYQQFSYDIMIPLGEVVSGDELATLLETAFAEIVPSEKTIFNVSYNRKLTITNSENIQFNIILNESVSQLLGIIGKGPRSSGVVESSVNGILIGTALINLHGIPYIILSINDYSRIVSKSDNAHMSFMTISMENYAVGDRFVVNNDEKEKKGIFMLTNGQRNIYEMRLSFRRPDGTLYEFEGVDHIITFRINRHDTNDFTM